ncbi:hypothetical protein [Herbaspirillum sp. alder98]|uniref:hypothetical protein n=1 Tax=Herbaspirillum sp. alder98 TaxID=2913096 RepID=UPI001CD824D3|nr:hypothetical protein [Herbaspirillum sp. alder98]MCA1324924.1 hypothetical protein [Herbaspirillum sp. alder98]
MKKFLVPAALLFCMGPALAANDIAGVAIGSSFNDQRAKIAQINPAYKLTDIKLTSGKTAGVNAQAESNGRVVDQFIALQDDAGVIWFVGRAQALEKGARIKPDVLVNSMVEKYGTYTELSIGSGGPTWQFDRQGKRYQGGAAHGPCGNTVGGSAPMGKVIASPILVPQSFSPKCGIEILTWAQQNDGMVASFSVQIADAKRMYDQINKQTNAEEAARQKAMEAEGAKGNKPKL